MKAAVGGAVVLALALSAATASAQSAASEPKFSVEATAGPQVYYAGYALSVAFGFAPSRSLTLLVTAQRSHTEDEIDFFVDGYGAERGTTEQFIAGELRYAFFPRKRINPYLLFGIGAGTSQPNVSELFPDKRERNIGVVFYGGGIRIPVRSWLDAVVDARLIMAAEGRSDYFGVQMPVRAGVAWRF